jgi:hypothetical protein
MQQSNTSDFAALSGLLALLVAVIAVVLVVAFVLAPAWAGLSESLQAIQNIKI